MQLDVLLSRRADGRLLTTRDPYRAPAPRVFLGRSEDANAWGVGADVDPALAAELEKLLAAERRLVPNEDEPPACRARVLELLEPVTREHRGPAYVLGEDLPRDDRAREVALADPDAPAWLAAFPWLESEFDEVVPVAIAFESGEPAAICHSPRGLTASAAEAGVETFERFRNRGLATAAVACWARAVQRRGRLALYSTSWDNHASQAVAHHLGARRYGEDWHVS